MMTCRYQSEKCSRSTGACLDNQIFHLKQKDASRIAAGLQPQYLVSRYLRGGSNTLHLNSSATRSMDRVQLMLPVDQVSTSIVTLEVAADALKYIENSAPGQVCALLRLRNVQLACSRGSEGQFPEVWSEWMQTIGVCLWKMNFVGLLYKRSALHCLQKLTADIITLPLNSSLQCACE